MDFLVRRLKNGATSMRSTFNLCAPAGFRGLHPDLPVRVYHRHLPHWRQDGATYFVTFRLHDSIPQHQLQALKRWRTLWEENHPEPRSEETWSRFASEITARTDRYLDQGYGECVFQERELADVMAESMLKFQNQRYLLSCFTVMPNHIHLAICPQPGFKLEELMQAMKGYVARKVNRILGRCGRLWEQESYDRIIRDEEHLWRVVQYIGNNACAAGLARQTWKHWIHEQWQQSGWKFIDQVDEQPKNRSVTDPQPLIPVRWTSKSVALPQLPYDGLPSPSPDQLPYCGYCGYCGFDRSTDLEVHRTLGRKPYFRQKAAL